MNEGIHLDLDTWIVPGQIRKANLCRGLGSKNKLITAGINALITSKTGNLIAQRDKCPSLTCVTAAGAPPVPPPYLHHSGRCPPSAPPSLVSKIPSVQCCPGPASASSFREGEGNKGDKGRTVPGVRTSALMVWLPSWGHEGE